MLAAGVAPPSATRRAPWVLGVMLLAAVAATYGQALGDPFLLWDDDHYVWRNPDVQAVTFNNVKAVFSKFYVGNYAPAQMLSYMADHALWGLRPAGFILTNVAWHAAAVLLLFWLLRRLGATDAAAFLAALVFAVHPVQVESVVWISQRKTLLAMVFTLATIHLHLRAGEKGERRWRWLALANVTFLVALLSKSVAVVVPVWLMLLDLRAGKRIDLPALREKAPYALTAAGAAALALVSQAPGAGGTGIAPTWPGGSPAATALTMVTVLRDYLRSLLLPTGLAVVYEPVRRTTLDAAVAGAALAVAGAAALPLAFPGPRRREAAAWCGIFFVGLLPVMQIVPLVTLRNDRYLYFPLVGVAGLVALAIDSARPGLRRAVLGIATAAALALVVAGAARTAVWRDPLTLWTDAAAKSPTSAVAWFNLGRTLHDLGRRDEAMPAYRRSSELDLENSKVLYNLAMALEQAGDLRGAAAEYRRALERESGYVDALYNLALLHLRFHEFAEVDPLATRLLLARPQARDALLLLGHARFGRREWRAAAEAYARARAGAPRDSQSLNYEAYALERAGDAVAAQRLMEAAIGAGGDRGRLLFERAGLESVLGRTDDALGALERALAAGFGDVEALRGDADLEAARAVPGFGALLRSHGLGGAAP